MTETVTDIKLGRGERLMELFAKGVSLLTHPLMAGVWMTLLVMYGYASPLKFPHSIRSFVIGNLLITTVAIPLLFRMLLRLFGVLRRDSSGGRRVRVLSLLIDALCFASCGWMFASVPLLFLVRKMLYLCAIATLVVIAFEFFRPLSHHLVIYGILLGYMWVLLFVGNMSLLYPFIAGVLVAGLLITSRLYLTSRAPLTLYGSLALGVLIAIVGAVLV